jgi:two-component system sensor histidine kinase PilS (NtrC family)
MYLSGFATGILGSFSSHNFLIAALSFVALSLLGLVWLIKLNFQGESYLLFLYLLIDIIALNLLMFTSGGLSSGIGLLLLVSIATGSLIFTGQLAISLAAIACILILVGTILSVIFLDTKNAAFFPAGLLGSVLFFTAFLFRSLNRRLQESQQLAIREADQAAHLQRLNELIVNRMRTGIVLVDTNAEIKLINNAAVELLGGHKAGAPLARGISLSSLNGIFKQYKNWKTYPWQRCPPLSIPSLNTEVQCNFARLDEAGEQHTIVFIEDTRSTVQNAQQLKLASLGRLAGSIAHEVRNPLGAISHAAQMLAEQGETAAAIRPLTDIISRHSERVNMIVDSILQLSRQEAPDFQKLQLNLWLKRFAEEYGNAQSKLGTIVINELDKNLQVLFDPVHLNQIITNLVENAHRYSEAETGLPWVQIDIQTDQVTGLPCLDIYDRGPGVEEKHLHQIFEPFFTTSNTGTGLGLYLARERCEFNYATLSYCFKESKAETQITQLSNGKTNKEARNNPDISKGFFRIIFAHPDQLLPATT